MQKKVKKVLDLSLFDQVNFITSDSDFRCQHKGLAEIVRQRAKADPDTGIVWAYTNTRRSGVKLRYVRNGRACMWYLKCDRGDIDWWPTSPKGNGQYRRSIMGKFCALIDSMA